MALMTVNVESDRAVARNAPGGTQTALSHLLQQSRKTTTAGRPVLVIMIHGYRYAPDQGRHCPHVGFLNPVPRNGDTSWPAGLDVVANPARAGISFGWNARGTIWQAHAGAARAGQALAGLIRAILALSPDHEIHAIGHSLGARVILTALTLLPEGALSRAILLAGADHASVAAEALASPAGRAARLLHVTSSENLLFDLGLRALVPRPLPGDQILGLTRNPLPGLPTLRLENALHLEELRHMGFPMEAPGRRPCHWSSYRRPGLWPLYRALTGPEGATLHAALAQITSAPAQHRDRTGDDPSLAIY